MVELVEGILDQATVPLGAGDLLTVETLGQGEGTVEDLDDMGDGDIVGPLGQNVTALGSLEGPYHSVGRQPLKDLGQQWIRDVAGLGNFPGAGHRQALLFLANHHFDGEEGIFGFFIEMDHAPTVLILHNAENNQQKIIKYQNIEPRQAVNCF